MQRRTVLKGGVSLLAAAGAPMVARAQAPKSIRIGYAVSLSGPYAPGAQSTTWSQYKLWAKDVNDAGGIFLKKHDRKVPIELIDYDDRSQIEEAIRLVERLILNDKVDLVLPPWGTATNLATAPVFNKHEYPAIHYTASAMRVRQLGPRWPYSFWALVQPDNGTEPLAAMCAQLKKEGKIKGRIAIMHVADQLGVEMATAMVDACKKAAVEVVYNKSYPLGVSDLQPQIREVMALDPDAFFCFSYPTDTFMVTEQAQVVGFSPPIFYTGVGTPFPAYAAKFGAKKNGVLLYGAVDTTAPGQKEYIARHKAMFNRDVEIGSIGTYGTLQILQKAIEQVGEIDRKKIRDAIAAGTFETVADVYTFKDQVHQTAWAVGQWQGDEVVGVYPADKRGAKPLMFPKPKW
ncbi:amino acid ABC transporter substrate-binding protein [Vineibacter terrae]|uniref:amino acid ABC transporter substrate-binding protein n=1 Tax=Vineibacter terrae TaxID=2586908 RepID=UPI002E301D3F|nr:amino acid ABC transporter substrate-binding protein [Vineibacter terrae]HEX2887655.1 amino acid ABC transporter substrate-binding protein [Vineibacter terrae]